MNGRGRQLALLPILLTGCVWASSPEELDPLDGVWRLAAVTYVMADGTEDRLTPQESLFLFKGGYYNMGFAVGEVRSPPYVERFTPTDEERAARMGALTVNAGTYEIVGSSVLLHPRFALVPEFVGGLGEIDFEVSGDSLQLRWRRSVSVNEVESPWTVAGHVEELTLVRIR